MKKRIAIVFMALMMMLAAALPAQAATKRIPLGTFGCAAGGVVHLVFKHNGPAGATVSVMDPNIWVHTTNPWATSPNGIIHAPTNQQFFVGTTIDINLNVKKVFAWTGSWVDFYTSAPVVPNITFVKWYCG